MADKNNPQASGVTSSGKKKWVEPKIEIAEGRAASATLRPGGAADFGYYS